jgi:hypothetical protein
MAENVVRDKGRPNQYKFDRGGSPTEMGPFIGIVVNNVDPTRSGRLQVYIEEFGDTEKSGKPNLTDKSLWRTVSYCPPFFGSTPRNESQTSDDVGKFNVNNNSYGMWFVPPDTGVRVLCFFVAGDPNQGYYVGCIPQPQCNQMVPAIGAVPKEERLETNGAQLAYFNKAPLVPVTEINIANQGITDNPKFFDQKKPVHSYVAMTLFQQGLINDPVRGPINSSSQRESPSQCFGIITPGRGIYAGNLPFDKTFLRDVQNETPEGAKITGRRGGHSLVMDDGDAKGKNNLVRLRTAHGHQILMSDDTNCFYIIHANGQTWLEFGQEGTVDVFSTNSVNVRTKGTINLHADEDVNIFAGNKLNMKSINGTTMQSDDTLDIASKGLMSIYSQFELGIKADGFLGIKTDYLSAQSSTIVNLVGAAILLNSGPPTIVSTPDGITDYILPDTTFDSSTGWQVDPTALRSIVSRAPTHEPYPYHNQGVKLNISLEEGKPSSMPNAPQMPSGWSITKE